ncbi:restriction endonuclease subunit S [uncultured Draconibacterium sp.]|uniref:restriction endonuclease subunit S n=1 Tax=uncultured Draconibacterium sp. TaxID=1573823 RepID=UPI0025DF76E2|nr:restriction endonuclease subunit S [uncultured Draconibacterium sp.]
MKFEQLGNIAEVIAGQSPPSSTYNKDGNGIPFFQGKADYGKIHPVVRTWCSNPTKISLPNDILISVRAPVGPVNINNTEACIGRGLSAIRVKENFCMQYVFSFLKANEIKIANLGVGSTFKAITQKDLRNLIIPTPDYQTQLNIANILSKAESLIAKRKESIRLLDEYLKSVFLEMFGDPGINNRKWETRKVKELSLRFSDGPFGSNLKTEHYSDKGIQVIRLQNIGINNFIEDDVKYVDEFHYENVLFKYSCYPNDVVIATMGAPNIRACIIPKHIKISVNKADCVVFRPNHKFVNQFYISYLFNQEGFLHLASSFIHGQTRARISSGQIAKIEVPVPPLKLQTKFAQIVEKTEALKAHYQQSLQELENLYGSLSQKAFKGELSIKDESLPSHAERSRSVAAEPEMGYTLKPNLKEKECSKPERAILAAYILNFYAKQNIGRVHLMKLLHLTEYHCQINIHSNFVQKAAGPYDSGLIKDIEQYFIKYKLYSVTQDNTEKRKVHYTPISPDSAISELFCENFQDETLRINQLLEKFRNWSMVDCEVASTLYAVWNNRILSHQAVDYSAIKQDFLKWSPRKKSIINKFDSVYNWMCENKVIPVGYGGIILKVA